MAHLQYIPGDPRLVDQLVYELKSKGIFDQLRKDCIADVDTRPAYQNLRQRVENSVSTFLSRQVWKPDLNKNQLREKLRKHILDGNYLEQGVERIVDQVVNPKMASVFIPQVEDLVYNYLGITRKKTTGPETNENKTEDLLPTDLEAVSPGSVKSNDDQNDAMETDEKPGPMKIEQERQAEVKEDKIVIELEKIEKEDIEMPEVTLSIDSGSIDKSYTIPLPADEINLQNIPAPIDSPPKVIKVELESIALPHEPNLSTDIPLPDEAPKDEKVSIFKPIQLHSEDSSSSSDSSLRRNMSPLTPIRNFNNENSCDAQQGFDNDSDGKSDEKVAPSSFRFTIETKETKDTKPVDNNSDVKADKKELEQTDLSYQFNNQVNINTFNTPMYDDSSNSNNLHIDYESDVNSKTNTEVKPEIENSQESKKEKKSDDRKSGHKSSHRSRDSSRHSSSKDKRSDSKHSTSRDSSRHEKKPSSTRDDKYKSSKERERSKDRSDRKDSRDSSKHRNSHKSSKDKDSRSHRSSSSSHRHSSKSLDERKPSSSKDKEKASDSSRDKTSKDKSKDSKDKSRESSSHRSDKDKKSSSSVKKSDDKDKKKEKKDSDDHYSLSGRGNHNRRSTDRDSNDGSSSCKGSHNQNGSKSIETKKESKGGSAKSDNTSTSGDSASPSDKERIVQDNSKISQFKPIVRVDNHLETPIANPPRLPFVPDVTLKKPRFAANLQEAKKLMKMRKFLDEEQKRMNQEAALLLEFQANVRPSLSQVYSSIPGPELEFACGSNITDSVPYEVTNIQTVESENEQTKDDTTSDVEVANISDTANVSETEVVKSPDIEKGETLSEIINAVENIVRSKSLEKKVFKQTDEETIQPEHPESPDELDDNNDVSYDENKPFSELMDEITEYSKISENKTKSDNEEPKSETEDSLESQESIVENRDPIENEEFTVASDNKDSIENKESIVTSVQTDSTENLEIEDTIQNKYFEVTIITEELSESEETEIEPKNDDELEVIKEINSKQDNKIEITEDPTPKFSENELQYFAEHEKYNAELERHEFSNFLKSYMEKVTINKKMYVVNCDTYEENIVKEMASTFGDFEVINYYKNGHLKLPNTPKNIVKNVTLSTEITLPIESTEYEEKSPLFSPVKSECSFELSSSEYDARLNDINKKSRQEVMEIILGELIDGSPSKMPKIDYYTETIEDEMDNIKTDFESEIENTSSTIESETENSLKRKMDEVESSVNNNRSVLTPNKIRKMSDSDQISSTTEETEEVSNNNKVSNSTRSKYLGRARRVGLPRPKRCNLGNSPSSDKSVENYVQKSPGPPAPRGNLKPTPRTKVQRYDTADLYKPKLHYLSRRHNVS